jgi:endoglucanase
MRLRPLLLMCALIGALSACGAPGVSPSAQAEARAPATPFPMRTCINMGNALESPVEGEWGYRIRFEDLDRIRAAGFEGIRLPVRWDPHMGPAPEYKISQARFERVDAVVDHALKIGLKVVLNVHHFNPIIDDPQGRAAQLVAMWRQIGARYKDYPPSLMFELLNEPYGDKMTAAVVENLNARALAQVRATNPTRLVIVGGPHWNNFHGLEGWAPPANDPNIAVTVHYYGPHEFTHEGAEWIKPPPKFGRRWGTNADKEKVRDMGRAIADWGRTHGYAMFLGEFGVNQNVALDQRVLWLTETRSAWEANGLAWCVWDYAAAFPLYDQKKEAWIEPALNAMGLARGRAQ